jgi:endoglucanase
MARFSTIDPRWKAIEQSSLHLLLDTSPKGFAPDWAIWNKGTGWLPDQNHPNRGSYDAIRVYLWVGMLADEAQQKSILVHHFLPMITLTHQLGAPPEQIDCATGKTEGLGSIGFSAALLPLLTNNPSELAIQIKRTHSEALKADSYYDSVLRLFGQGWNEHRYRFNAQGELQ